MLLLLMLVVGVLFALLFIFLKEILSAFNVRLNNLRSFLHQNSGVFTLFFIFLFFVEQILLLLFVSYLKVDSKAQLLIGIFALIVLTTATIEKFILEKKYQYLVSEVSKVSYENEKNFTKMKELYLEGRKLAKENFTMKIKLKKQR